KRRMKNFCITFFILFIIIATVIYVSGGAEADNSEDASDYLRLHVRANSNSEEDQAVKYKVKDAVVEFIAPYAANCRDKASAMETMAAIAGEIEDVCDGVLKEIGFNYSSSAEVRQENFPTRVYGDVTLESGLYDALIIELGSGEGDNWWCVLYPPLCFTSASADVEYRSIIYDIIQKFFN
ncbi:MAG: stage II sporulation protein R, partial [Clostridia bacterium]|nr:stage II sporulation protein R [Clostridia bacterium]